MKQISKLFVLAIASMAALASCQKVNEADGAFQPKVLKAVFEDGLSKTTLSENLQIQWSDTDAITGFDLDGINYTSTSTAVSDSQLEAEFTFGNVSVKDDLTFVMYPADKGATINNSEVITTTLPLVQTAVADSFDSKANLALADGGVEKVKFLNAGGLLAFNIKNDNVNKIEIEAGSNENFAGPATLSFDSEHLPLLQSTYKSDIHKVTLQGEFVNGKTYYAVVIPGEYSSLKMVFTRNDGKTATYTNSNTLSVERNSITSIWNATIDDSKWQGGAPTGDKYVKMNAVDELEDNMEVVIVAHDVISGESASDTYYAIPVNPTVSSGKIAGNAVTVVDDEISASDAEGYVWTLEKSGDFYVLSDGSKNLYHTNGGASGTNLTYGESTTLLWDITAAPADATEGTFKFAGVSQATVNARGLLFDKTADKFGGYALTNISNSQYCGIDVYMKNGTSVKKYTVTCATVDGGTLSANPAKAEAGATVTLTATPATEESAFNNDWSVKGADNTPVTVTDGKFTMPAQNVTVSGSFSVKTYAITKTPASNGSFSIKIGESEVTEAVKGARITLAAEPVEGYKFDGFTVKETVSGTAVTVSNNAFTMPAAAVTVSAAFSEKPVGPTYEGSGTEEDPYTINDAYMFIDNLGTETSDEVCVKGTIYQIDSYNSQYKSITYWIGSSEKPLEVYGGLNLKDATPFASKDDLRIGDEVVVKGKLKKYVPTSGDPVYEFDKNNYLVAIKKIPYLKATASKTKGIAAAGETITVNVDTNVEDWTANSDNAAFSISGKTATSFNVVVSANNTSAERTAKITVSATGINPVEITLKQAVAGGSYESSGTLASWTFTEGTAGTNYPSNKTNFANNGSSDLATGTFYLDGTGSTWNSSKGYAFTAVTSVTITVKAAKDLKKGAKITFSMDTYYNKSSNAPMTGFTLTAAEGSATASTTGLSVTSFSLSNSSANKSVVYTLQNDVAKDGTVKLVLTQIGKAGAGQGFIGNVKADYAAD